MLTPYDTGFSIGSAVTGAVVGVTQSVGHAVSEHLDFSQWMKSGSQAEPVEATDSTADPHERERQLAAQRTEFNDAIGRLLELFQKIGLPGGSDFSVAQGLDGQWQVNGASELRGQLENQLNRDSEWNERLSKVLEEVKSLVDLTHL